MEKSEKLRIVLDTNVVLSALSPKLNYRHLLRRAFRGEFEWCVTTEILLEYEEKVAEFFGQETATTFIEALLMSGYVKRVEVFYRFAIIPDIDDNKFVDCAFASNAHYIVSEDKAFAVLDKLDFPKLLRLKLEAFDGLLKSQD